MCGLLGWIGHGETAATVARIQRVLPTLAHRGPDDAGCLVYDPHQPSVTILDARREPTALAPPDASPTPCAHVVLGHRRLAIIDTTASASQPMASPDGRRVIVLNGEIYNHVELRRELEAAGHRFRSRSDTEVLLAAFDAWGAGCLARLVGMFAFAIVDVRDRTVFLARDCFGIKPLYYCLGAGHAAFASEIGALVAVARPARQADPQAVLDYLDTGITDHGDATMLGAVRALPPAHYAVIALDRPLALVPACYWAPDLTRTADLAFDAAAGRLRDLFLESVTLHLRSDVPVGAMLSGGLDSAAIVMAMRHVGGDQLDIHTFSYVGSDGAVDESPWIDLVNRAAAAVPHPLRLGLDECAADIDTLLDVQGEPFRTLAVYAQYRLFALARASGVRVVLEGHGSDELLAGYPQFRPVRLAAALREGPRADVAALVRRLGPRQVLQAAAMAVPAAAVRAAWQASGRHRPWVAPGWLRRAGVAARPPLWATGSRGRLAFREALWMAARERSLPSMLRYQDRNAMAHSIENRVPFLTPALAEFVLALPPAFLVSADGTGKSVFRAAMKGIVPEAILRREKLGFSAPMHAWLPRLPTLPALLERAARIPAVRADRVRALLERADPGHPLRDVLLRRRPGDQAAGSHWIWWLAGLASWAERFDVRFD